MTIKEMENRVNNAKRLQKTIIAYKAMIDVIEGRNDNAVQITMSRPGLGREIFFVSDHSILPKIAGLMKEEMEDAERTLAKLETEEPEEKFFDVHVPYGLYKVYRLKAGSETEAKNKVSILTEEEIQKYFIETKEFSLNDCEFDDYLFVGKLKTNNKGE